MENNKNPLKSEYDEMLSFIQELQKEEMERSENMFAILKEHERKIRQRELVLEEQGKRRSPNIAMFSPLDSVDAFDEAPQWKEELVAWREELPKLKEQYIQIKERTTKLNELNQLFLQFDPGISDNGQKEEVIHDYSTKLLETQELDRNRIARDLHDSTVQSLTTLVHQTEFCSKLLDIDPVRVKLELQSMIEMIRSIINDMREIIYDLRPMSLNNIGLDAAIDSYCTRIKKNEDLNISLKVEGEEKKLSSIVRVTLYRIMQEACNNIIKHAAAHRVFVSITYDEEKIKLEVEDDGVGFDIEKIEENTEEDELHGFGLSIMRERANLLNGTFSITSQPGKGTKITVIVPV
ncbi:MAG: sensor histidine kinase [Lachnospiraceae bacterium]